MAAPYPTYRRTECTWLPKLPAHWALKPLKVVATCNDEALSETTDLDYEFDYVDISSVSLIDGIKTRERMTFEKAPSRARRVVRLGDSIVSTVRTYLKAVATIDEAVENLIVSTGFAVLRPGPELIPKFLGYYVQSQGFVDTVVARSTGVSYPAILASELVTIPAPIPSPDEQEAIAAFLDRESTRIDALIAKKRRLLESLEEKRLAVITHAVTKGIDPNVSTINSGVAWLGQIPAHWKLMQFRRHLRSIEQGKSPVAEDRIAAHDEWAVLKLSAINKGAFLEDQHKTLQHVDEQQTRFEIRDGDLLMTRANTLDLVGDVALVCEPRSQLTMPDLVYRLNISGDHLSKRFALNWWLSMPGRHQIKMDARGTSMSMAKVAQGHIRSWLILVPPVDEQEQIVLHVGEQDRSFHSLAAKIETAIERLREYRSALITCAVTGQIDVRGEFSKEAAA